MRRLVTPRLALLALAHFSVDAYSSFVTPLLPLLVAKLGLSLTEVGTLVALFSIASSLSQPLFGLISDRLRHPWFVAFGPLVAAVCISAVGLAHGFGALAAILMLGGLGAASFHPQAAALATATSDRRSLAFSVFVTGGTLGFSLGPLYAVTVVGHLGLERTWTAALPGVLISMLLAAWFARVTAQPSRRPVRAPIAGLKPVARPLMLLYFAVVCRSAVSYGFATFLPILLARRGHSVQEGGAYLAAYLGGGAVGGLAGGWLADRIGGRRVVIHSFLGALPFFVGFLLLPQGLGMASLIVGGLILQSSLPVNVAMGQELSPAHRSTISSLLMGAAWGLGVMLVGPTGALADARGLPVALGALLSLLVVGFGCGVALPDPRRDSSAADLAAAR